MEYFLSASGALDVTKHDLSVFASFAQLRVIFVFLFVSRMLIYLNRFGLSKEAIKSAKKSARDSASAAVSAVSLN